MAKEICDAGRIEVNSRVAKAGTEVKVGDVLTIHYGGRTVSVRILQIAEAARKESAADLYEVLSDSAGGTQTSVTVDD